MRFKGLYFIIQIGDEVNVSDIHLSLGYMYIYLMLYPRAQENCHYRRIRLNTVLDCVMIYHFIFIVNKKICKYL